MRMLILASLKKDYDLWSNGIFSPRAEMNWLLKDLSIKCC